MERYEIDIRAPEYEKKDSVSRIMIQQLNSHRIPFFIDEKLLFWMQHFDGDDFATYDNGHKKGGTLRFKESMIRIPSQNRLDVFESSEFEKRMQPRAVVSIDSVVVCKAKDLTLRELEADGFSDHKQMLQDMRGYYPTMNMDSIVSFYTFGQAVFTPRKK